MFSKMLLITIDVLLCAFQLTFAVDEDSCVKRISLCPSADTWVNRNREMNCIEGTYYACIKNKHKELVEGCFPNYQIKKDGCPYVSHCNSLTKYPTLAANFLPCPSNVDGCPKGENYYISQIKKYKSCIAPSKNQEGLIVGPTSSSELVTVQAISSTKNITTKDFMSTNDSGSFNPAYVVAPLLVFLLLLIVVVILIRRFHRKRKAPCAEPPGKDLELGNMSGDETKGLPEDKNPFLQSTETQGKAEKSLSSTLKSLESWISDLSDSSVQKERNKELLNDEATTGVRRYDKEKEVQQCCKRNPAFYCVTCCENFEFCKNCGNSHFKKFPKHDIIACSNKQSRCRKHNTFPIRRYCRSCQDYICETCITSNRDAGGHEGHDLQLLCSRIIDLTNELKPTLDELNASTDKIKFKLDVLNCHEKILEENNRFDEEKRRIYMEEIVKDQATNSLELNRNRKRKKDLEGGDIKILEKYVERQKKGIKHGV